MSQSVKTPARIPKKDRQAEASKEVSAAVALDESLIPAWPGYVSRMPPIGWPPSTEMVWAVM